MSLFPIFALKLWLSKSTCNAFFFVQIPQIFERIYSIQANQAKVRYTDRIRCATSSCREPPAKKKRKENRSDYGFFVAKVVIIAKNNEMAMACQQLNCPTLVSLYLLSRTLSYFWIASIASCTKAGWKHMQVFSSKYQSDCDDVVWM